jgi:hypothetical protein
MHTDTDRKKICYVLKTVYPIFEPLLLEELHKNAIWSLKCPPSTICFQISSQNLIIRCYFMWPRSKTTLNIPALHFGSWPPSIFLNIPSIQ